MHSLKNGDKWTCAGAILEYFRLKTTNLSMTAFAYPGLSDAGRIRADTKAAVTYELIKNLYLTLVFT